MEITTLILIVGLFLSWRVGICLPLCPIFLSFLEDWLIYSVLSEKSGCVTSEEQNDLMHASKPLKAKTSKAERRALQEAQRAAKAATKGSVIMLIVIFYVFVPYSLDYYQLLILVFLVITIIRISRVVCHEDVSWYLSFGHSRKEVTDQFVFRFLNK